MRISDWSSDVCSSDLRIETEGVAVLRRTAEVESEIHRRRTIGRCIATQRQCAVRRRQQAAAVRISDGTTADIVAIDLHMHVPAIRGGALDVVHRGLVRSRSEEHTSELQSLMRISYAVFCLTK